MKGTAAAASIGPLISHHTASATSKTALQRALMLLLALLLLLTGITKTLPQRGADGRPAAALWTSKMLLMLLALGSCWPGGRSEAVGASRLDSGHIAAELHESLPEQQSCRSLGQLAEVVAAAAWSGKDARGTHRKAVFLTACSLKVRAGPSPR